LDVNEELGKSSALFGIKTLILLEFQRLHVGSQERNWVRKDMSEYSC